MEDGENITVTWFGFAGSVPSFPEWAHTGWACGSVHSSYMRRQSFTNVHRASSQSICIQAGLYALFVDSVFWDWLAQKWSTCSCLFRYDVQSRSYYARGRHSCFSL